MKKYKRTAVERIFLNRISDHVELSDDGVRLSRDLLRSPASGGLVWHPANELEGMPGAPDPLEDPNLPIPFSGSELAAFMIDGVGAMLPEVFGDWKQGPDEACLETLGPDAAMAREALRDAYEAYRSALSVVGPLDDDVQRRPALLNERLDRENGQANEREGVFEPGVSNREKNARRFRARVSVAHLLDEANAAERLAVAELAQWRKAIVRHLWASADHDAEILQSILDGAERRHIQSEPPIQADKAAETKEQRQARRHQMCVDAGLAMPLDDYASLPRGIGKVAAREKITRQAFAEDVKAHINRMNAGIQST